MKGVGSFFTDRAEGFCRVRGGRDDERLSSVEEMIHDVMTRSY